MALALWALTLIYGGSIGLLLVGRLASRRWRPFRRFLIGEQADEGWQQRAEASWRRGG